MTHAAKSEKRVRVAFKFEPDAWHGYAVETIWCVDLGDGTYRVDNIPFYARGLAWEDVVKASPKDGLLVAGPIVRRSGHSTYRVFTLDEKIGQEQFLQRWARLSEHGCSYEGTGAGLFVIDVPASADCSAVYAILEDGERQGIWDFEEGHYGGG